MSGRQGDMEQNMEKDSAHVHLEADEARGGETPHILRYVLMISLGLAIVALSTVWITGALSQKPAHTSSH
jgi:hypothetical protein